MSSPQTTGWLLEQVFIEALTDPDTGIDLTTNVQHFHTDVKNQKYPLVFVRAVLDEEDPAEIRLNGQKAEIYNIEIGTEWKLENGSGLNVDKLARQCRAAIEDPDVHPATLSEFGYLRMERKPGTEREIEKDTEQQPTRRVEVDMFSVTAIRAS